MARNSEENQRVTLDDAPDAPKRPVVPFVIAGVILAGSLTPLLSTGVLGIHSCDPLKYASAVFASVALIGFIIIGSLYIPPKPSMAAQTTNEEQQREEHIFMDEDNEDLPAESEFSSGLGEQHRQHKVKRIGEIIAGFGIAGTAACLLAGLGMIQQDLLQDTLSGRMFVLSGTAPAALETGPIVGVDFAFYIGGALIACVVGYFALRSHRMAQSAQQDEGYLGGLQ